MIITPYSAAKANLATTAADFPALKHAWTYAGLGGTPGALSVTDIIGGVVFNAIGTYSLTDNGDGTWTGGAACSGANLVGVITAPNDSPVVGISVFKSVSGASAAMEFGSTASPSSIGAAINGSKYINSDDGSFHDQVANTPVSGYPLTMAALGIEVDFVNNNSTKYLVESGMSTVDAEPAVSKTGDINDGIATLNSSLALASAGSLVGVYYFIFTTLPTDVAAAVSWMAANPGYVYPGWAGVS